MSASHSNLKHPVVITGVIVGLVVVAVVNVRTFAPVVRGRAAVATGDMVHGARVDDLDAAMEAARRDLRSGAGAGLAEEWPGRVRDPFRAGRRPVVGAPVAASLLPPEPKPVAREGMVCTAVFLGGRRPLAMLNGATLGLGGVVDGHTVLRIATDGVLVKAPAGHELFLPVGPPTNADERYHFVTGESVPGTPPALEKSASERSER